MKRDTLTETKIKQLRPKSRPYKVSDGTIGGMHLLVPPTGKMVFYQAYQWEGKTRLYRLGAYPVFKLDEAREMALAAKKLVALGTNPAEARNAEKKQIKAASTTFRMVAAEWVKWRQPILSPTTTDDIVKRLENHVMPRFGNKPIAEVTKADIKAILDGLQARGTFEALKQVRISISQVLRYAIDTEAALHPARGREA